MKGATFHIERILNGSKTALLIPALVTDRYCLHPGGPWQSCQDRFVHDQRVYAIRHLALKDTTTEGEAMPVRSVETREVIRVQITDLRMAECPRLTAADIRDLGYDTNDAYQAEMVFYLMQRPQAWLAQFIPLLPTARAVQ